jgi:phosphopantothenoylcysteine decarboxylase/phosphopantothenate--cysteine ligase
MAEPLELVAAIENALARTSAPLAGRRALVTAGPTREPLDPVRFLANRSSGKQGYAIAEAFVRAGAETVLVSGPVDLTPPARAKLYRVETAREMMAACESALPVDVAVFTAAVADWRPSIAANHKMKKQAGTPPPSVTLEANPDILAAISQGARRPSLVIGFAAETEDVIANAQAKLLTKHCDWIVANDVGAGTGVMGGDRNTIHLVRAGAIESWPELDKLEVGRRLVTRIAETLKGRAA